MQQNTRTLIKGCRIASPYPGVIERNSLRTVLDRLGELTPREEGLIEAQAERTVQARVDVCAPGGGWFK